QTGRACFPGRGGLLLARWRSTRGAPWARLNVRGHHSSLIATSRSRSVSLILYSSATCFVDLFLGRLSASAKSPHLWRDRFTPHTLGNICISPIGPRRLYVPMLNSAFDCLGVNAASLIEGLQIMIVSGTSVRSRHVSPQPHNNTGHTLPVPRVSYQVFLQVVASMSATMPTAISDATGPLAWHHHFVRRVV